MSSAVRDGGPEQHAGRGARVIPFGKYILLERVSVGGMAEVYRAKAFGIDGHERIVAIKRILPQLAEDRDFITMFIDEARIAGELHHENICPIYELGKIGDAHYIAMEFIWGKDLLQIINRFRKLRRPMPPVVVAWIGSKMCEALDYAHRKRDRNGRPLQIIHRDVSPQNVLVTYDGQVKLIDFGIAKAASRSSKTEGGTLKGKFGYMSPEQVRGLPVDVRSDVFSAATCMYEMATSERLFLGESDFATLEKVRNAIVAPLSKVLKGFPPQLEEIIQRSLRVDPADRWQSAGLLHDALEGYLAEQRPPYGTPKLAAWMKTAFAAEISAERERFSSQAPIGRAAVVTASPGDPEMNAESTIVTHAPPLHDDGPAGASQIFFSADAPPTQSIRPRRGTDPIHRAVFTRPDGAQPPKFIAVDITPSVPTRDSDGLSPSPTPGTGGPPPSGDDIDVDIDVSAPIEPSSSVIVSGSGAASASVNPPRADPTLEVDMDVVASGDPSRRIVALEDDFEPATLSRISRKELAKVLAAKSEPSVITGPAVTAPIAPPIQKGDPGRVPETDRPSRADPTPFVVRHDRSSPTTSPPARGGHRWILPAIVIAQALALVFLATTLWMRGRVSTIEVRTSPSLPASIYVDGALRGQAPLVIRESPGRHTMEVRLAGYRTVEFVVDAEVRDTRLVAGLVPVEPSQQPVPLLPRAAENGLVESTGGVPDAAVIPVVIPPTPTLPARPIPRWRAQKAPSRPPQTSDRSGPQD